jgi:hypothetical protein
MQTKFQILTRLIETLPDDLPTHVLKAMRALPPSELLPPPRATWLLLALFAYRERQEWAKQFVRKHLREAVPPSDRLCGLCEKDPPLEMAVPGDPEWQVNLETGFGYGLLIHRSTRELITFGLSRERREVILFLEDFGKHVKPASRWEPAGRALELNPDPAEMWRSIDDLAAARIVDPIDFNGSSFHPWMGDCNHRLNRHLCTEYATAIVRFLRQWEDANRRLWLAAMIGDWELADELARTRDNSKLITLTSERAEQSRELRREADRVRRQERKFLDKSWRVKAAAAQGQLARAASGVTQTNTPNTY